MAKLSSRLTGEVRRWSASALRLAGSYLEPKADLKVLHYRFRNWGDAINPTLAEFISGSSVQSVDIDAHELLPMPREPGADTLHLVVGSTVHHADCQTVIWGAGFQEPGLKPRQPPKRVCAVRGPLTARELQKLDIACPEVFGDPVLLLPRYYRPEARKRYRLGIIPHFSDRRSERLARYRGSSEIKIIDIRGPLFGTVNQICECEHIVSSSLHGLILADAYAVPNLWAQLGDQIPGGTFKFIDYYSAIGSSVRVPGANLTEDVDALCRSTSRREILLDLDRLLGACPFRWTESGDRHRQAARHGGVVQAQLP